ncbi:hypothetical protein BO83DRAFT_64674 [Aspergillus eucalypticola CBS 122712]|uniref:Uncharacterized protein n=1 Tax=Aspergillus eucalypticola (strain CBS 122712 / IBT 29274) TaxID=1448314 RepID=A0A317V9X3_ASPEC|nr:uncharacterized protein BO83DRAFT_64674 [Aspergillus eucalypticola CBS 122712]PWY70091.1 hypothetical protein BO83DRAFT_64674 [Aspergillus eucalypticola CBS 122712]
MDAGKKESMDNLSQLSLETAAREIPTAKASDSKRGSKAANHQAPWLSFGNSRSGRTGLSLAPASLPHFIEFGCNFDLLTRKFSLAWIGINTSHLACLLACLLVSQSVSIVRRGSG